MKKLNLQKGQKLSREAQKNISGGGLESKGCVATGCYKYYFSDGSDRCLAPSCFAPDFGTIVTGSDGRSQCCY